MIEYALLFGLGFLSAALITVLLAPAVYQRIVRFTENRLKATMPLSPQEIRAQKDMARALFAAENAKTTHSLHKEREKSLALQLQCDELSQETSRVLGENQDLTAKVEEMNVEAGELRSQLHREESEHHQVSETLRRSEEAVATKDLKIANLDKQVALLAAEVDELKIESSAREMEIDNLKQRVQILRDEREELRREAKLSTQRAKEAEQRLSKEEHVRIRLDDRLVRAMADNADRDALIERREAEIERLKDKLKQARADGRAAERALRAAKIRLPKSSLDDAMDEMEETPIPAAAKSSEDTTALTRMADELRNRQTALAERLIRAKTSANDEALREEIADIAARMVVMTAANEGKASPVRDILAQSGSKGAGNRMTLAERTRTLQPGLFERSE